MNRHRILGSVSVAFCLAGCHSLSAPETEPVEATAPLALAAPLLGNMTMQTEGIYSVLAGDLAAQRGALPLAYQHYLRAAQLGHSPKLAELATKAALAAHDFPAASAAVALWLSFTPEHLDALEIAVLLHVQQGDYDGALLPLRLLVAIQQAKHENGYLAAVRTLLRISNPELRLTLMQRLVSEHPHDLPALFALAVMQAAAQQLTAAEGNVRKVLAQRPTWGEARLLLVRILSLQAGKKAQARQVLEGFLKTAPDDNKLRGVYARLLLEQADVSNAQRQFERLLKHNPHDGDALFALGGISLQQNRLKDARYYLTLLYEQGEHRDDAAYLLGQLYEDENKLEDAARWYGRVEGDNQFDAQVRVARLYAQHGELSRAQEIIQQIRGLFGKDVSQVDLIEAEILREVKRYDLAMTLLDSALEKNPDNHSLLYTRGLTAANLGRMDLLERDLKRVIEQDPQHADALNALGYTLADQTDRYAEALGYIERALRLKPDNPAILDSMGWLQYRMGQPQAALSYLRRALELLPDAEIASHLGEALWAAGQQEQARRVWKEALNKTPGSEHILKVQERHGIKF